MLRRHRSSGRQPTIGSGAWQHVSRRQRPCPWGMLHSGRSRDAGRPAPAVVFEQGYQPPGSGAIPECILKRRQHVVERFCIGTLDFVASSSRRSSRYTSHDAMPEDCSASAISVGPHHQNLAKFILSAHSGLLLVHARARSEHSSHVRHSWRLPCRGRPCAGLAWIVAPNQIWFQPCDEAEPCRERGRTTLPWIRDG